MPNAVTAAPAPAPWMTSPFGKRSVVILTMLSLPWRDANGCDPGYLQGKQKKFSNLILFKYKYLPGQPNTTAPAIASDVNNADVSNHFTIFMRLVSELLKVQVKLGNRVHKFVHAFAAAGTGYDVLNRKCGQVDVGKAGQTSADDYLNSVHIRAEGGMVFELVYH